LLPTSSFRLRIDDAVSRRFPGYAAFVVWAEGLENGPSDGTTQELLRSAEESQRRALGGRKPSDHPHMAAWREAYRAFGLKPSRYLNSAEALLARVLKGETLPAINRLVDVYNALSVARVVPTGGEDLEKVVGSPTLVFASGTEPFDTIRNGLPAIEHPERGEVVWLDDQGVTCRGWNWRQGVRTRLTETTRRAYFILDRLEPYSMGDLCVAGEELADLLRRVSPGCSIETHLMEPSAADKETP
jgi:DNA/RNA-binding domain of Phe-tRNA-synthetase-like protein